MITPTIMVVDDNTNDNGVDDNSNDNGVDDNTNGNENRGKDKP